LGGENILEIGQSGTKISNKARYFDCFDKIYNFKTIFVLIILKNIYVHKKIKKQEFSFSC